MFILLVFKLYRARVHYRKRRRKRKQKKKKYNKEEEKKGKRRERKSCLSIYKFSRFANAGNIVISLASNGELTKVLDFV